MGMGLGGFYRQAYNRDFSRDFQMRVVSIGPGVLFMEDNVFITSSTLPGYQINNQAVPFMGLQFNVPGSGSFPGSDAWAVTFRCDQGLAIRQRLIDWQSSIFNAFVRSNNPRAESTGAYGPKDKDTVAQLTIFNRDGAEVRGIQLVGCYPVTVGEIAYDSTANGNVVTMPVTLAYQWWERADLGGSVIVPY